MRSLCFVQVSRWGRRNRVLMSIQLCHKIETQIKVELCNKPLNATSPLFAGLLGRALSKRNTCTLGRQYPINWALLLGRAGPTLRVVYIALTNYAEILMSACDFRPYFCLHSPAILPFKCTFTHRELFTKQQFNVCLPISASLRRLVGFSSVNWSLEKLEVNVLHKHYHLNDAK